MMTSSQYSRNQHLEADSFSDSRVYLNNGLYQGDYLIGPHVNFSSHPVKDISEYIAKREESDDYVILKVVDCKDENTSQSKILLHNEHLILSLLQDKQGIIHHHGLYKHGTKFILVLDCLLAHEFDKRASSKEYINLQQYIIQKKQLNALEALQIFSSIARTLKDLHQNNIVHRDIKLGNIIYNQKSGDVTLINFALSKHLVRDYELLTDQCGSLAYVSPEILSGKPYDGKASDMWAMGVLLYTMVCGQFPFYDSDKTELFKKIHSSDFRIPSSRLDHIFGIINMLIVKDPLMRCTALQTLDITQQQLFKLLDPHSLEDNTSSVQVVPKEASENIDFSDSVVPETKLESTERTVLTSRPNLESYLFLSSEFMQELPSKMHSSHAFTIRSNRFSLPALCGFLDTANSPSTSVHLNTQSGRRRRNSSGSDSRLRRHSTAALKNSQLLPQLHQRRRSHDIRDEQADILDRLCVVANTRTESNN